MSTDSFNNKYYSILLSLNERTIYIKATDNINYLMYETNVDLKELRLLLDLKDVYKIMVKCFSVEMNNNNNDSKIMIKDLDYSVNLTINSSVMKMAFSALVGGYLNISFEILLREKLMSNDGQLTVNFNRLEQQQTQAIRALTEKCANLEDSINKMQQIIDCCQIFMTNIYTPQGNWCDIQSNAQTHLNNISAKEITMQDHGQTIWKNINVFYQLEKLTITNFNAGNNMTNLSKFSNRKLTELTLNCHAHQSFTSLEGIQNFPNLEILTITAAPGLKDVVTILKATNHKIKTLKFQTCTGVNVVELQTYCQVNNIFLAIS
jgi:hypothetical protein